MKLRSSKTALARIKRGKPVPEALSRLRPLPHREPKTDLILHKLPPEIRNTIYALALPPQEHGLMLIHDDLTTSTTEPALLRVAHYTRDEAGSIYYADHRFILELDGNASRTRWAAKHLEGIADRYGPEAFKNGLQLKWKGTGAIGNLDDFFPLVVAVWRTGIVLAPFGRSCFWRDSSLAYLVHQLSFQNVPHETDTILMLVALGMRGHEQGWSDLQLQQEMHACQVALVSARAQARAGQVSG